jgi:hypothetical protein
VNKNVKTKEEEPDRRKDTENETKSRG